MSSSGSWAETVGGDDLIFPLLLALTVSKTIAVMFTNRLRKNVHSLPHDAFRPVKNVLSGNGISMIMYTYEYILRR